MDRIQKVLTDARFFDRYKVVRDLNLIYHYNQAEEHFYNKLERLLILAERIDAIRCKLGSLGYKNCYFEISTEGPNAVVTSHPECLPDWLEVEYVRGHVMLLSRFTLKVYSDRSAPPLPPEQLPELDAPVEYQGKLVPISLFLNACDVIPNYVEMINTCLEQRSRIPVIRNLIKVLNAKISPHKLLHKFKERPAGIS